MPENGQSDIHDLLIMRSLCAPRAKLTLKLRFHI